jgi:hypothetical protein
MREIYVSTDIEADGPIPGPNSMLSFGSAAFEVNGTLVSTFTRNLETLEGASGDPETMRWWSGQQAAWEACRTNTVSPQAAMPEYCQWLKGLPGKPVFVGYPASYDQMFIHWYNIKFAGEDPMGFSGIDMKTYAMCLLGTSFKDTSKRNMPKRWFSDDRHDHVALGDAIGQGKLFLSMLQERSNRG